MHKTIVSIVTALMILSIGAAAAQTPSLRKSTQFKKWHWYELSDRQAKDLASALANVPPKVRLPVMVICSDPDCRDLAKDMVDAFDAAKWKSAHLVSSGSVGGDEVGLLCSTIEVCNAIKGATGIKAQLFGGPPGQITLIFGPKTSGGTGKK